MSLVTTCPSCGTRFRFNPVDVSAHGGEGRCSVCRHVFNALNHVTPMDETATESLPPQETETTLDAQEYPLPAAEVTEPQPVEIPHQAEETPPEPALPLSEPLAPAEPIPETLFVRRPSRLPFFLKQLTVVSLLLAIALIQVALFYRQQVINVLPSAYPLLAGLCQPLACTAPLPRQSAQIAIEDYRLLSHPDFENVLILESTLRNHARYPQAYPVLELTLTDQVNAPVAIKNLAPEEYQPDTEELVHGIPPSGMTHVQVYLGIDSVQSSKYKLIAKDAPVELSDS